MKTITPALDAHLSSEVTNLCTCWKIVRLDGTVFGFTDHDMDLTFDDGHGPLLYESDTGYNRTAIRSDESMSVDNLDVTGFIESDRISENDLRNGVFDFASVYIFAVNWSDLTQGPIKLRRGWLGEITLNQNGVFETEIRGLHQALSYNYVESYQPECRADFCDARCTLNIADFTYNASVFTASSRSVFQANYLPVVPTTGSSSAGAHSHWRILVVGSFYTDYVGFAEVKFFDQSDNLIGGNSTASSSHRTDSGGFIGFGGTNFGDGNARDNDPNTTWQCAKNQTAGAWWKIDFGEDHDVKSVMIVAPLDDYHKAPMSFDLQYSENGSDWTTAYTADAHWSGAGEAETWTIGNDTSDPVGYSATMTDVPPPFNGISTFVGGTITFNSGLNKGKTIEIIAFDAATNTITVMENFPYVIGTGDLFTITQGCDKRFDTCKVYNNQINFRGEPHVPGQDSFLSYPDAHN